MKRIFKYAPVEIENHVFLDSKGKGYCESLIGDVLVTVIFVDDAESNWSEDAMEKAKETVMEDMQKLLTESRRYGAKLKLSLLYKHTHVSGKVNNLQNRTVWCNEALKNAELPGLDETNLALEKKYKVKDAPFIFALNKKGRAYACPSNQDDGSEFALVFENLSGLNHEILHCFGAEDLYYPEKVYSLAKKLFPDSIMHTSKGSVDSLTAYLVGWTEEVSPEAMTFLTETAHLTQENIWEALREETKSGFYTKRLASGVYTGNFVEGVIDGHGKLVYDSGDVYEGNWSAGCYHGLGTMKWANGTSYSGNWKDGKKCGVGKLLYADGSVYDGSFENDLYQGNGTMKWAGGSEYSGNWSCGKIDGVGTMKWKDGTTYSGEWKLGKCHGHGTMTWSDGKVQSGMWKNGLFVEE